MSKQFKVCSGGKAKRRDTFIGGKIEERSVKICLGTKVALWVNSTIAVKYFFQEYK